MDRSLIAIHSDQSQPLEKGTGSLGSSHRTAQAIEQGTRHSWSHLLAGFGDGGFAGDVPALGKRQELLAPAVQQVFEQVFHRVLAPETQGNNQAQNQVGEE